MKETKLRWHKVAGSKEAIEWQKNDMAVVKAGGKTITLVKHKNQVFACADKCPHAGALLAEGFISSAGYIVCPLHGYRFNLSNGRDVNGEGYFLKTFAVEEREAGIFIGFEENTGMDIFS